MAKLSYQPVMHCDRCGISFHAARAGWCADGDCRIGEVARRYPYRRAHRFWIAELYRRARASKKWLSNAYQHVWTAIDKGEF